MVDLVKQLREVQERDFHPDSLRTMVLWGADEVERLRAALKPFAECWDLWQGDKPPECRALMFASEGGGTFLGWADVKHLRIASETLRSNEQSTASETQKNPRRP